MKDISFCVGLPRTGSTLLMNILQQHPALFTTSTCPLPFIVHNQLLTGSRHNEYFLAMDSERVDSAMYGFIHGGMQGWFNSLTDKPKIISKNRAWSQLLYLFPNGKVIVCVRDLRDIAESFNNLNNKIKALHTFGEDGIMYQALTEKEKYNYFFGDRNAFSSNLHDGLHRIIELAERKDNTNKFYFIRYEDFLRNPQNVLTTVTEFLELTPFNFDLNNIKQSELYEHDNVYFRERTSHKTKEKFIPWEKPNRKLSENFHNNVVKNNFWFYEKFYRDVIDNERLSN